MSNCVGCNRDKKLIKAHSIPEAFFREVKSTQGSTKLIFESKSEYPKNSPIGVYDTEILCGECEEKFQLIDDYAIKTLIKEEDLLEPIVAKNLLIGYKRSDYDYKKLKLFFVSILWRASVSKHRFYDEVELGPYEEIAKNLIWSNTPGPAKQFSCMIAKFKDNHLGKTMLSPIRIKQDNRNYYQFYLSGYVIYIKVDNRPSIDFYQKFEIRPNSILYIVARDINKSYELSIMINVAKSSAA